MSTVSANSSMVSHCLQQGVKLDPLTSGAVSFYLGFKAEIALQSGNDVMLNSERGST